MTTATAMKPKPRLKNLDDLFLLSQESSAAQHEQSMDSSFVSGRRFQAVVEMDLLSPFAGHPFRLYEGERLDDMVESIKENGVLVPIIAREKDGKLEILAGHNRVNASRIAGHTAISAIILKNVSDEEAWIYVVETNLMQRSFSDMSHSEKAAVISVQHSKLFSQGKRNDILAELDALENPHEMKEDQTFPQVGEKSHSDKKVGEMYSLSKNTVARYLRIYKLIAELKSMLDAGVFAFVPAVTLSFLKESEQRKLSQCMELNGFGVDMKKADALREYSESGKLDDENIYLILNGEIAQKAKPNRSPIVKVSKTVYARYFQSDQPANTVVVKPSALQQDMVKDLSARAAEVHRGSVDPSEDNMLKITSDGRKIGLDQRLISPMLPDDEGSKVNACMNSVYQIWNDTKADRSAQLLFCDFSTPNKDGRFNVYDDIRDKLLAKGIPPDEIAFIHEANTETRKKELFAKVRQGKVRILMGSTFKMGSGTNVQDRLIHLHDLDCPWRPSDLEQRAGRIVRQGNINPEVGITRYVTEGTFDAYLYQTIENKQKFISQIMSSKSPVRSCEDVDEAALSYAEIKALCAGNPLIKEKMDLDIEVARLRLLKADHQSQLYRLEDDLLTGYPKAIESAKESIAGFKNDQSRIEAGTQPGKDGFSPMEISGVVHRDKKLAGEALLAACKQIKGTEPMKLGSYCGLDMSLSFETANKHFVVLLKGHMSYGERTGSITGVSLGEDVFGNITRLNNAIAALPQRLDSVQKHLDNLYQQVENAEQERQKPFPFETELELKSARLAKLDSQLNMDASQEQRAPEQLALENTAAKEQAISAKKKPSILESLKTATASIKAAPDISKEKEVSL